MNPKPFLKWAGGKTQLLPQLVEHIPTFDTYYDPFVGAGALLFELQPKRAVVSDINAELINCYKCIAHLQQNVINHLDSFPINKEFFHKLRAEDRTADWHNRKDPSYKAARIIYLNKTCYNGLYRVNLKGEVNSPWGYYDSPALYELDNFKAIADYICSDTKYVFAEDFQRVLSNPTKGDFVYLDPPYDILNDTSNFTGYATGGFHKGQHTILKSFVDKLTEDNVKVLQSNADTQFIRELYKDYEIIEVQAKRSINSKGNKRGNVTELLIKNY